MSSPDKRSIIVRVEVEICGSMIHSSPTVTVTDPSATVAVRDPHPNLTVIKIPLGGATPANVRVSGGIGYICAKGKSVNAGGTAAIAVWAKIYPAGTLTFPKSPPPCTTVLPDAGGNWLFSGSTDIPGAANNAGGTAGNILYTWADYDGSGNYEGTQWSFLGKTNTMTDCGGSGSSSGSKVPREWRVIGEGFAGAAAAFNIASLLRLERAPTGQHVWTNGGNRTTSPSIELRHADSAGVWELIFRYLVFEIRYTCPSAAWHPLNANTLHLDAHRKSTDEAPASLQITPV